MGSQGFVRALVVFSLVMLGGSPAWAEVELKSDGFVSGQPVGFQSGFAIGDVGAVRFHPPSPGREVTRVQFMFGGAATQQTITLRIWNDVGTNAPGAPLFSGDFVVTGSNSSMHELDLSGENIVVSGDFRVGIEFQHAGAPAIARDYDGNISVANNFIFSNGSWARSGERGVAGDWIIRAFVGDETVPFDAGSGLTDAGADAGVDDVVELSNDSFTFGDTPSFQSGLDSGDVCAARFDLPSAPHRLTRVRFLFGGAITQQTITLRIWDDIGTNAPGTQLFFDDLVVTGSSSAWQEISLDHANILISDDFRVGLEFQHAGVPSAARDDDGVTAEDNFLFTGGTWYTSSTLGVVGDWIIRTSVEPYVVGGASDAGVDASVDPAVDAGTATGGEPGLDAATDFDAAFESEAGSFLPEGGTSSAGGAGGSPRIDAGTEGPNDPPAPADGSASPPTNSLRDGGGEPVDASSSLFSEETASGCACHLHASHSKLPSYAWLTVLLALTRRRMRRA
ncbi:MAG TPA: hypothetical protein VHO25_00595 [Polyangiaceae bacterium]|nr:hypothetical protein [Polyangiaceae bacterium]